MKRIFCVLLCLGLMLCGCKGAKQEDKLQVVATIFPAYDLARQIGGEGVSVQMLLPPGGEVHSFEPSLQDIAAINNCDVFIYNGGESDVWVEDLLKNCDMTEKTVVRMMDHVELLVTGEEHHHHDHHHSHEESDEHIWTTPANGLAIARAIAHGMERQDAKNGEVYQQNFSVLEGQLTALSLDYEVLKTHSEQALVVADRFPFYYLASEYDLHYVAAFEGCTSNTEASLATLAELTVAARKAKSPTVLYTEFSDRVLANTVAQGVGADTALLHSCHNVTKEEFESGVTYVTLMKHNLTVLKEALGL